MPLKLFVIVFILQSVLSCWPGGRTWWCSLSMTERFAPKLEFYLTHCTAHCSNRWRGLKSERHNALIYNMTYVSHIWEATAWALGLEYKATPRVLQTSGCCSSCFQSDLLAKKQWTRAAGVAFTTVKQRSGHTTDEGFRIVYTNSGNHSSVARIVALAEDWVQPTIEDCGILLRVWHSSLLFLANSTDSYLRSGLCWREATHPGCNCFCILRMGSATGNNSK